MKRACLLISLTIVVTACGSAPEAPAVKAAAAKTLAQGSAKTHSKQVMAFADESQGTLTMESEGVIDFASSRQHATMTSEGDGGQAELMAAEVGDMEMISEGFVVYFKSKLFQSMIPGSEEWLKLDLQAAGEKAGLDLGSLTQFGSNDPAEQLKYLKGVEGVEEAGTEVVRGVETTHYTGTASFEALKEELDDAGDETIDRVQEMMGIDDFDVDVWLDPDGIARRMTYVYDVIPVGTTPAEGTWTFTLDYYDFGTEVDIELPPKEEVTDMLEVLEEMGRI